MPAELEPWPSLLDRHDLADHLTIEHSLSRPESAVLRRILYRAGAESRQCTESQVHMAAKLGFDRKTINRAIIGLVKAKLIRVETDLPRQE